jgi:alpha-glucosidase
MKIIIQIILPTLQMPIHSIAPFLFTWAFHHNLTYGIFFDNSYKSFFNFGRDRIIDLQVFPPIPGEMNYYFIFDYVVAGNY